MAKKITDLPALTVADDTDLFAVVDVSGNVTKKVPRTGLVPDSSVDTGQLTDGAVTPAKTGIFPLFEANRTSVQTFSRSSTTRAVFNNLNLNEGGGSFNTTTGVYTAPISGIYLVSAAITLNDSPVSGWIALYVNGSEFRRLAFAGSVSSPTLSFALPLELDASDEIDVRFVNQQTTRDPQSFSNYNYFSGRWLGPIPS